MTINKALSSSPARPCTLSRITFSVSLSCSSGDVEIRPKKLNTTIRNTNINTKNCISTKLKQVHILQQANVATKEQNTPKVAQYSKVILLDSSLSSANKANFSLFQIFLPIEIIVHCSIKICNTQKCASISRRHPLNQHYDHNASS